MRAHGREVGVGEGAAHACAALDEHVVAGADELARPGRGQRDAVLVVLDLAGYTDSHAPMVKMWTTERQLFSQEILYSAG